MSKEPITTEVDSTGLRYKSKAGGSPFGMAGVSGGTMSCYKCGQHKPRSLGTFRKLLGKSMFMCAECNEVIK